MKPRIALTAALLLLAGFVNGADSARTIYRCETASGITFADRPCGGDSQPYEADLSAVSVIDTVTPEFRNAKRAVGPQARQRSQGPSSQHAKAAACERLEQSLRKIVSAMRAGYSARQGERLRERKRELDDQRRAQRC